MAANELRSRRCSSRRLAVLVGIELEGGQDARSHDVWELELPKLEQGLPCHELVLEKLVPLAREKGAPAQLLHQEAQALERDRALERPRGIEARHAVCDDSPDDAVLKADRKERLTPHSLGELVPIAPVQPLPQALQNSSTGSTRSAAAFVLLELDARQVRCIRARSAASSGESGRRRGRRRFERVRSRQRLASGKYRPSYAASAGSSLRNSLPDGAGRHERRHDAFVERKSSSLALAGEKWMRGELVAHRFVERLPCRGRVRGRLAFPPGDRASAAPRSSIAVRSELGREDVAEQRRDAAHQEPVVVVALVTDPYLLA